MSPAEPFRLTRWTGRRWLAVAATLAVMAAAGVVLGLMVGGAGASSRCTTDRAAPSGSRASTRQQETVLDAAYARMVHGPACLAGDRDVVDYGIGKLWSRGIDGAGTTIALAEGWDDPSIDKQVAHYDRLGSLPNPQITTIYPSGDHKLPAKCASSGFGDSCSGDKNELQLDVLSAHLMAPYAKIVIFVTPADSEVREDAASQGDPPEMMQGVEAISRDHLANVISISYGAGESTYRYGRNEVTAQDPGELAAAAAGIPVAVATGDCGPVQPVATATGPCTPHTTKPEIGTWDDSPWTLAVGGSTPSATGSRIVPGFFPENAGFSSIFARPSYQNGVASVTHSRWRSVPDITMDNSGGTSESAPLMAGVLALATQANGGHDLGPINPALYDVLGPKGAADGIVDITRGNDSLTSVNGKKVLARGYTAHKGFDVASGWGTIYAPRFVPAVVRATRASHDERPVRAQAAAQLAVLRRAIDLSPASVTGATTSHLTATGFLPLFPVVLSIDGRKVAALHADGHGDVSDTLVPSRLHLRHASNTVTLTSMLITVTGHLTVQ
ncbi:MAG TPA: S8 family serine peptidase [Solirubrobacteraceae bacterium]